MTYKGHYFADIVLVVELKCVERLASEHIAQCINLRASGLTPRLLVNLPRPKVEWKRIGDRFTDSPRPIPRWNIIPPPR